MRNYEAMYILRPTLEQEAVKELVEKFQNVVTKNGGEVDEVKEMGKRRLAYEIKYINEGFYFLMKFHSPQDVVAELERNLKIADGVLRFLVIKNEE